MPGLGKKSVSGPWSFAKGIGAFLSHGLPDSFSCKQLFTLFTASCTHLLRDTDQASAPLLSVAFLSLAPKQTLGSRAEPTLSGHLLLIAPTCLIASWCAHAAERV